MKFTLASVPDATTKAQEALTIVGQTLEKSKQAYNKDALKKQNTPDSKFYTKLRLRIRAGDAIIAEVTKPSTELGYLISEALTQRKPVLLLTDKSVDSNLAEFFGTRNSKFLSIVKYTKATLEQSVESFVGFSAKKVDTKFILIITPEIDTYLRWKASEEGVKKAEVVRTAVENYISKDSTYINER